MRDQKLYESVGKYIDKYYIDKPDDIKLDKEMKSIFDRISEFRKKKATKKCNAEEDTDIEIDESAVESFDVESMQKMKATDAMSSTLATNRNIESLMGQMDETFSQRLLRLIDERGMTDSEAYNKAYVDRRHFSKIRKDVNYTPNKKTVLAFAIALELSIDEAKDLLNSAGFAFSRSSKTDIIVAYFLQNVPYLYMLSTDGFSNSFVNEEEFHKTCREYYKMIGEHGYEAVRDNLEKWLKETSELGCGDDVTMVMAYIDK